MRQKILLTCFVIFLLCPRDTFGLSRRVQDALLNANQDFLNMEGNRRPPPPVNPEPKLQATSSTSTSTSTVPSTTKSTTPASNVRQLIKKYDDKIADKERQGTGPSGQHSNVNLNRQGVSGSTITSQNANKNQNVGPTVPTNVRDRNPQIGNVPGRQSDAPRDYVATLPKTGPVTPTLGTTSTGNPDNFPSLPKSGGNIPTPTPRSWSSVVSGNNKPGSPGNSAGNVQPNVTPKSAQNLSPIALGGNWPTPGQSTTGAPIVEIFTDKELGEISEALLKKDNNNAAKFITVNYQGKTTSFSKDDLAPQPLFTIQPAAWNIPTISAMKTLLDNYEQDVTVNEYITPQEKNEENAFLDAVMATPVMRHLMSLLKEKGLVSPDPKEQRDVLKQIWFNMYSRGQGRIGSSGFEHIFLSEIKNGEISGLHNWIYFHLEEAANRANYLGFLKKVEIPDKGAILKLHFTMKGIDKPVDTMFVGTSPELEMALYTLCFMTRVDRACPLILGGHTLNLRTHNYRYRSKNMIGSAFPEI